MTRNLQAAHTDAEMSERDSHGPDVLTQVQVCARLGICDETWRRWRKAKRPGMPEAVLMPNGRLMWRTGDIDRLVGQQAEPERPIRRSHFGAKSAAHARNVAPRLSVVKGNSLPVKGVPR